jgi:hypothetical protein
MEIPDLVRGRLGDEEVRAAVNLGDEDAVCLTPTRTLVYRGEGLLSDESVTVLSHDVERIVLSEGRRKTSLELHYVEGPKSFSVPKGRADTVLELLMDGVLRVAGVTEPEETVQGVYRFSELTLLLTDERLVKHVGSALWDEDFEEFPFADVTGLDFEEGSVATQIVISIDGRPQRIKAPNDEAPMLRQTLEEVLFAYHGVDSLAALNRAVAPDDDDEAEDQAGGDSRRAVDLTLDDGIDPLVGGGDETGSSTQADSEAAAEPATSDDPEVGASTGAAVDEVAETSATGTSTSTAGDATVPSVDADSVSRDDIDEIGAQLEALTTTVKKQNKLLRKQQATIKQLIEELRQGR